MGDPYRDDLESENARLREENVALHEDVKRLTGAVEDRQRVIDDVLILHTSADADSSGLEATAECFGCGAGIDPAWYGYMGYSKRTPKGEKLCDLCWADRHGEEPKEAKESL